MGLKALIGVEIGVLYGGHAIEIMKELNIKKFYLIDDFSTGGAKLEAAAKENLKDYNQVVLCVEDSTTFEPPEPVDFVYIDGDHSYEAVRKDLNIWDDKTKIMLSGHDYSSNEPGVIRAVNEFCRLKNYNLHRELSDWWILKGE